jgi:hypothetical protein
VAKCSGKADIGKTFFCNLCKNEENETSRYENEVSG